MSISSDFLFIKLQYQIIVYVLIVCFCCLFSDYLLSYYLFSNYLLVAEYVSFVSFADQHTAINHMLVLVAYDCLFQMESHAEQEGDLACKKLHTNNLQPKFICSSCI